MNSPYSPQTQFWRLPKAAVEDSLDEMARDGACGNEGIVLWLGSDADDAANVTHLVRLRGPLVEKRKNYINIHPALFNDIADLAIDHGVRLLGHVHSHGPGYGVDLSPIDRICGIQVPSYLSLVAPDYARTRSPLHDWGVHVFIAEAGYIRLSREEARRRLQVTDGIRPAILTVGVEP